MNRPWRLRGDGYGNAGVVDAERQRLRVELADGKATTVNVVAYEIGAVELRVVRLMPEGPFERWCDDRGIGEAVSGGFATKPGYEPLGELWIDGRRHPHRQFRGAWANRRAALTVSDGQVRIDHRDRLEPGRHLLQAGPLLVHDGRSAIDGVDDPEGFSATAEEFDQDLTASREPRLAIAIARDRVLCVSADGRSDDDAGATLWELADLLVALGASEGMNLDGGSASALVSDGARRNVPRDDEGNDMAISSPSVTGIIFSAA